MLKGNTHDNPYLIYNVDETSVCFNKKGKLIILEGKNPFVSDEKMIGHMTAILSCNVAGRVRYLLGCVSIRQ